MLDSVKITKGNLNAIKALYTYRSADTLAKHPLQKGQFYVWGNGDCTGAYAIYYVDDSETIFTEADIELLSTVTV